MARRKRKPQERALTALERQHHIERVTEVVWTEDSDPRRGERVTHDRIMDIDSFDWLYNRGKLGEEKERANSRYLAGCLLRRDWQIAGYDSLRAAQLTRAGDTPSKPTVSDAHLDAQDRVRDALRAIGQARQTITVNICCAGERIGVIERNVDIPQRSAVPILLTALDDLADHYRTLRRM